MESYIKSYEGKFNVVVCQNDNEAFGAIDAIEAAGFKIDNAEVTMIPSTTVDLDLETAPKLLRLIDMLEDCDDVQNVYHNGEISDEVAAQL